MYDVIYKIDPKKPPFPSRGGHREEASNEQRAATKKESRNSSRAVACCIVYVARGKATTTMSMSILSSSKSALPMLVLLAVVVVAAATATAEAADDDGHRPGTTTATTTSSSSASSYEYGVDVSWPTHHPLFFVEDGGADADGGAGAASGASSGSSLPQQQQQQQQREYRKFRRGCARRYGSAACGRSEYERLARNLRQPQYQLRNFTSLGFAKFDVPVKTYGMLRSFWEANVERGVDEYDDDEIDGGEYNPEYGGDEFRPRSSSSVDDDDIIEDDDDDDASPVFMLRREDWGNERSIYVNHWDVPTDVLLIDDPDPVPSGGGAVKLGSNDRKLIADEIRDAAERWINSDVRNRNEPPVYLLSTSAYGIRSYRRGNVAAPHLDRLPHVVTAVVCVAQKRRRRPYHRLLAADEDPDAFDEPWPFEFVGRDGVVRNVTMEPGYVWQRNSLHHYYYLHYLCSTLNLSFSHTYTHAHARSRVVPILPPRREMILYEGHSVVHGNPFPLQGDTYAVLFLHFEPAGYTEAMERKMKSIGAAQAKNRGKTPKQLFEEALAKQQQREKEREDKEGSSSSTKSRVPVQTLPSYIEPGSEEEKRWTQQFLFHREEEVQSAKKKPTRVTGVTTAHVFAATGNMERLKQTAEEHVESLFSADSNGWKPIHEAARAGRTEALEFLIKKGADVNERTNEGRGANALWWAKQQLPDNHPTIRLLEGYGAVAIGPNE